MNLQPLPHMYTPVTTLICVSCGQEISSDAGLRDVEAGVSMPCYCVFCADQHDSKARERLKRAADDQWRHLSGAQQARARAVLGLIR